MPNIGVAGIESAKKFYDNVIKENKKRKEQKKTGLQVTWNKNDSCFKITGGLLTSDEIKKLAPAGRWVYQRQAIDTTGPATNVQFSAAY